jgi:hypothetical protein
LTAALVLRPKMPSAGWQSQRWTCATRAPRSPFLSTAAALPVNSAPSRNAVVRMSAETRAIVVVAYEVS